MLQTNTTCISRQHIRTKIEPFGGWSPDQKRFIVGWQSQPLTFAEIMAQLKDRIISDLRYFHKLEQHHFPDLLQQGWSRLWQALLEKLIFYREDADDTYQNVDALFTDVVDWDLIRTHWQDLMQVAISIQQGHVLPSMLLRKLRHDSRKNRLYRAFREVGCVIRTIFCFAMSLTHDCDDRSLQSPIR